MVKSAENPNSELEIRDESVTVAVKSDQIADNQLREIRTFRDAVTLAAQEYGGELVNARDLSDGFTRANKAELVGKPFIIMGWGLGYSEFGDINDPTNRYSIVRVVTDEGEGNDSRKLRFVDGSTGIHKTLMDEFAGDPQYFRPVICMDGLSVADYTIRAEDGSPATDAKGKPLGKGTTYRLAVEPLTTAR